MSFSNSIKKTFQETSLLHRLVNSQWPPIFTEEELPKIDQKNYNNLQVGVLKKIAELKYEGNIQKFIASPEAKKVMAEYREFVKAELPFLLSSPNNPQFDFKDEEIIDKAAEYIIGRIFPKSMALSF
jgi:hypothetical protein